MYTFIKIQTLCLSYTSHRFSTPPIEIKMETRHVSHTLRAPYSILVSGITWSTIGLLILWGIYSYAVFLNYVATGVYITPECSKITPNEFEVYLFGRDIARSDFGRTIRVTEQQFMPEIILCACGMCIVMTAFTSAVVFDPLNGSDVKRFPSIFRWTATINTTREAHEISRAFLPRCKLASLAIRIVFGLLCVLPSALVVIYTSIPCINIYANITHDTYYPRIDKYHVSPCIHFVLSQCFLFTVATTFIVIVGVFILSVFLHLSAWFPFGDQWGVIKSETRRIWGF